MQLKRAILFVALSQAFSGVPEGFNVQITPDGSFKPFSRFDGRIGGIVDQASAQEVIDEFNARKNDLVVDYEHQTLLTEQNGQPAPAAGWIKALAYVAGQGLFAQVEWTDRAREMIARNEYKYISPVLMVDKASKRVQSLLHVGLTNAPAIDGMNPVALSTLLADDGDGDPLNHKSDGVNMDLLVALRGALGLKETDTAESALSAVAALKAKVDGNDAEIVALKAKAFDPTKHVTIEDHKKVNDELVALRKAGSDAEVAVLVDKAIASRQLAPAQKEWAVALGQKDVTALKEFLKDAPEIVPGATQTGGKSSADGGAGKLDAEQLAICKSLGLKPEDYAKQLTVAA